MSRPEVQIGPGDTVTLDLAQDLGDVEVVPIRGEHELWIAGRRKPGLSPVALETLILQAGMIENGTDPSGWLLGDRNRALLAVLSTGFGAPEELWVTCPECDQLHEVPFDVSHILNQSLARPERLGSEVPSVSSQVRLPTGADLEAAVGDGAVLLSICAPHATEEVFEAEVKTRDPCAELYFALTCVACGKAFKAALDPLALLLAELDRHGGVTAEIDMLAQAYSWTEAELVALPAWRRRFYFRHQASERMAS
ncbi:MAG: hypothetical protein WBB25_01910 [Sulfitobacter sp.]